MQKEMQPVKNMQGMSGVNKKLANNSWLSRAEIDPLCSGGQISYRVVRDFGFISRFSIFHFPIFLLYISTSNLFFSAYKQCPHKPSSHRKPSSLATSALNPPRSYSIPTLGRSLPSLLVFTNSMKTPMHGRLNKGKSCFPVLSSTSHFYLLPTAPARTHTHLLS